MKSFLKWTLLLTGLMPLVYSADSLFPFIFPKALYFRGLIFIAVIAFCVACAMDAKYRDEMIVKIKSLWHHFIFKVMALLYGGLVLSTIFAFDRFMGMFGNIEREEGFVGLFFFYMFFVLTSLVFEKKDWLKFFAVSLFTGGVLFLVEFNQYAGGNGRPGSLTDNPIFLSAYYLFTVFAALVIWKKGKEKNNVLVMTASILSLAVSFLGLILAETRGVVLGGMVGFFIALVCLSIRNKNITIANKISLRKFTVILAVFAGVFFSIFIYTRTNTFWTHVPGLKRLAQTSITDGATRARLINTQIALHVVNPKHVGITRSLFGWGWDNYVYAWQAYYDSSLYGFDQALFDRAHNKIMDVVLMSGFVGLVLYLALWFLFFKKSMSKDLSYFETVLFVFWASAYFIQNLTVFDTMVTFITFYAMFAYLTYETNQHTEITK